MSVYKFRSIRPNSSVEISVTANSLHEASYDLAQFIHEYVSSPQQKNATDLFKYIPERKLDSSKEDA